MLKPTTPLQGYALDLITDMSPSGPFSERHILIIVDCFSKWVELVTLHTKESLEVTEWFTQEFIPRFGVLKFVRLDAGLEFQGAFQDCCELFGV